METREVHIFDSDGGVRVEGSLHACCNLSGVRGIGCERRLRAIDGGRDSRYRCGRSSTEGEGEDARGLDAFRILLKPVNSAFLNRIVQKREREAIVKQACSGAKDPLPAAVRLPRDAEAGRDVMRYGTERRRQHLGFVSDAAGYGHTGA